MEQSGKPSEFRALADAVPNIIFTTRSDGKWDYVNYRFTELTGQPQRAGLGDGWVGALEATDARQVLERWREAVAKRQPFEMQFRVRGPDGVPRWFLGRAQPVPYEARPTVRWCGTWTDIDRLQRVEQALRRSDGWLAMLSHELRNPLAPIRNAINLLQASKGVKESELRRAMDMIGRQVSHLTKIADDLLDIGRVINGQMEFQREPLRLAEVIRSAAETAQRSIHDHGHQLHLRLPAEPLRVFGDRARLSQAIVNLLQNAAEYTKQGSVITLTLEREADEGLIKVRDRGIGIAAELLPHVFDVFVQADRSLARSQGGLGLGLALVRTVAAAHGGHAQAYSSGPGRGSEFVVYLPLTRSVPCRDSIQSEAEKLSTEMPKRRVLVVDDNKDVAQSFAALLMALGHEVKAVFSSMDALGAVESFKPEAVFLDIGLPEMDGYELARRIRERHPEESPILFALSGYGQEEYVRRSQTAGFQQHLVKPPDIAAVRALLAHARFGTD